MSELIIQNKQIDAPIEIILETIREETHKDLFREVKKKVDDIVVTCPFHKNGEERRPSASIYCGTEKDVEYGTFNCFACHTTCSLAELVNACFEETGSFGGDWLVDRFGCTMVYSDPIYGLKPIEIAKSVKAQPPPKFPAKIGYHPYMQKRKISEDIANRFMLGYDENNIYFPLRNSNGGYVGYTSRGINKKRFDVRVEYNHKPVYLLYEAERANKGYAIITEAQIDALTAWSRGIPACAMIGTGAKYQYDEINKSSITTWICMFDNDEAGRKATEMFKRKARKDFLVIETEFPSDKKDINDLTDEEFFAVLQKVGLNA